MLKKFKSIGLIIFSLIISAGLVAMPFIATAGEKNDYNPDYLEMKSVDEMYIAYHTRINDMFNDAIKKSLSLNIEPFVGVSSDDTEQVELCENSENIAAICLGFRALYEYHGYQIAMTKAKDIPKITLFKDAPKATLQTEAAARIDDKSDFIDRELERSLQSQEDTLDFYTEFMGAQQMHRANIKLIESLEVYNEKLGELRTETYYLPPQFHNVTTDGGECT